MSSTSYDIITVGGGLGGVALAKAMAENGARVLVLESETKFRDRVRGEAIVSWGVAEAKNLGIYDVMKAAGAREVEWVEFSVQGWHPRTD
jgi:2-polyprenyl-6-methoxyphenol hydroxylase-like FAD-dependent oxidoreductase